MKSKNREMADFKVEKLTFLGVSCAALDHSIFQDFSGFFRIFQDFSGFFEGFFSRK